MKVIISHDVDHLLLGEHWRDTFVPGLMKRSAKQIVGGQLSVRSAAARFSWRLNRIRELHEFNQKMGVPATWFFGMRTGLNLSYHWRKAKTHLDFLRENDVAVGLHGMAYDDLALMREEKKRMEELLEAPVLGIRNHYLRQGEQTIDFMEQLGFKYDSTDSGLKQPTRFGSLMEFPISIMDVDLANQCQPSESEWLQTSWKAIDKAAEANLPYFVVDFHDIYFSNGWPLHRTWYQQFVRQLGDRGFRFIDFKTALSELAE